MLSKKLFIFLMVAMLLSLVGCGIKTGEKSPEPEVAKVQSATCLRRSISDLKVYFKGEATEPQVDRSFDCLQEVFIAFKDNIRGEHHNAYTPREIATFIEMNFLPEDHFDDAFLAQVMHLKVALFGGDDQLISKAEIDQITDFVQRLKPDFVRLNPYMKIITQNWTDTEFTVLDADAKENQFLAAKAQFKKLVLDLTTEFANGHREYKIDDLLNLAIEIVKFDNGDSSTINTIQNAAPFLKKFKAELIGGNDSLKDDEWGRLGLTLNEAYFQDLRYQYFLKNLAKSQIQPKWSAYGKVATDLTGLVAQLLASQKKASLSNDEIISLAQSAHDCLPSAVSADLVQQIGDLLNQSGDLKLLLLGDTGAGTQAWSAEDFARLQKKLPTAFELLGAMSASSGDEFTASQDQVIAHLPAFVENVDQPYDLEKLRALIVNLSQGALKGQLKLPDNFDSLFRVAVEAKVLLTGEEGTAISAASLRLLLNVGIRGFLNYSEYQQFVAPFKFESPEFMIGLQSLTPHAVATLQAELDLKSDHLIVTPAWTRFILFLQNEKIIMTKIQETSLNQALNALWSNILNKPEDRLQGIVRPGFDSVVLAEASRELGIWVDLQKHIAQIFSHAIDRADTDLIPELQRRSNGEADPNARVALNQIQSFLVGPVPLTTNEQGFLQILDALTPIYHQRDLTLSNLSRALARLIIRAYAGEMARVEPATSVLQDEVQLAYDQLKPLAVDLEVVEASNNTFIKSRFLEANLFLSVSNGDQYASFDELHHLIIHILSGIQRAAVLRPDLTKNCLVDPTAPVNGQSKLNQDCVLDQFAANESAYIGMPQFLGLRTQFIGADLRNYYFNLLEAAGHVPNDEKTVKLSDADLFVHVVQYVEMVYARHDTNHDNLLSKDEALAAFPIFKRLLADLVKSYKQIKDEDLPGVFIYILKYGRPPRPQSIGEVLKFVAFIKDKTQKDWTIASTRLDLGNIFNYIASATAAPPAVVPSPAPVPAPTPGSGDVTVAR